MWSRSRVWATLDKPENGQYVFLQTVAIRALPDDSRMTSDDHRGYYEVPPPEPLVRTAKQPDRLGLAVPVL